MNASIFKAAAAFVICALASVAAHATNRCVDTKARVTYQDAPCEDPGLGRPVDTSDAFNGKPGRYAGAIPTPAGAGNDPAYATARGSWRGPAQLHLTFGSLQQDPRGVTSMVIEVKPDGRLKVSLARAAARSRDWQPNPSG